jgi:hypothetical protein
VSGIVTFAELDTPTLQWICDPLTYRSLIDSFKSVTYQLQMENAKDLLMTFSLYQTDEKMCIPLCGLYKGFYPDIEREKRSKHPNYMDMGSWNFKNPLVSQSIKKIISSQTPFEFRDIFIMYKSSNIAFWTLGFLVEKEVSP